MGQHARARVAGLALIVVDAPGDRFRSGVEIRVGHHDMGRLAAAFERHPLHVALARIDQHQLADFGRAGEGDHVDVRMERERLARFFAEAGHDIEHAVRQPRLLAQLAEKQRSERRLLGRLQDDGIARDQRRPELPGRDDERIVPRHDRADDAERLLQHHCHVMRADRRDLVEQLVGELGVILDAIGAERDVDGERIRDRLADVERLKKRELFAMLADEFGEAQEDLLFLGRVGVAPDAALEGLRAPIAPPGRCRPRRNRRPGR